MLEVIRSKCLRIPTDASCNTGSRQTNDDFDVPFFAYNMTALTASLDSKLGGVEKPLVRQLDRYLC